MTKTWVKAGAMLLAAGMLATAPMAWAQQAAPGQTITLNLGGGGGSLTRAEAEDLAAYEAAMRDFQRRGFAGLESHRRKLDRALARAPANYPAVERRGELVIVRAMDPGDAMVMSLMASVGAAKESRETQVVTQANVYPMIALILGSAAVERQDYAGAVAILDRGLALQPNDRFLLTERLAALQGLGRWQEALDAADAALASGDMLISSHPASLLRKRGFSLIELGRLDEAQAAYEESLKTEPDNAAALRELEYIGEQRRGLPRTAPEFIAPAAPRAR